MNGHMITQPTYNLMGKMGGNSWLTTVKRAFMSPTKENEKRSSRRREDQEQGDEEKKRGKRRWIFKKSSSQEQIAPQDREVRTITTNANITPPAASKKAAATVATSTNKAISEAVEAKQSRQAIAVAIASTAAAQAAVATAQAAVEAARLSRPSILLKHHLAAIVIQTAFRGYLARRALCALKGLVKLQALVRGHNVRKRANVALRCMQALIRVQARVRDQRKKLSSHEDSTEHSMLSDGNSFGASHSHPEEHKKSSYSRDDSSSGVNDCWIHWDHDHPQAPEEIQTMLKKTKESSAAAAASKREKTLAYAFSHQIWKSNGRDTVQSEGELDEIKPSRWLDRRRRNQYWENTGRASCDQRESIKNVEIDTSLPYSYSVPTPKFQKSQQCYQPQRPSSYSVASPLHRAHDNLPFQSDITPSPSKTRPLQVYSASPRCLREERNYPCSIYNNRPGQSAGASAVVVPNYMAATASAKARFRSQSAPRQRPLTPEREKLSSARKRLSFPVPDPFGGDNNYSFRSPCNQISNFHGGHLGMDHRSNMSCCTDSIDDEIYPSSINDLRRWLR